MKAYRTFILGAALAVGQAMAQSHTQVCTFEDPGQSSRVTPFSLPWMNAETTGTAYSSASHANGIFVVEAYFLGCPYCNDNAPNVNDLTDKYASSDRVQVLDVGVDRSDADYEEWIRKHQPNHPVLKDAQRVLIKQLGTTGYPSTYVVDCKGNVVYKTSGVWNSAKKAAIHKAVDTLLAVDCHSAPALY